MLGRFLSEDPKGFLAGINLYSYVGNDPVNFSDPLGMDKNLGLKDKVCSGLPEGRTVGLAGAMGAFGGVQGNVESLINYSTGEISGFASWGGWVGYVGGASGGPTLGLVRNLGNDNSNYSGPFTNASVAVGPFGLTGSAASKSTGFSGN